MYVKGLFEVFKILGRIGIKPKDVIGMGGDIVKMGKSLFNTRVNPKLLEFIAKNQKIPPKILENIKLHARTLKNTTESQKNLYLENIKSIQKAKTPIKIPKAQSPVTSVYRPGSSGKELPEWTKGWTPKVIKGGKDGLATGGIANHFRERVGFSEGSSFLDSMKIRYNLGDETITQLNTLWEKNKNLKSIHTFPNKAKDTIIADRLTDFASDFKKIMKRLPTANEIKDFKATSVTTTSTNKAKFLKEGVNFMEEADWMKKIKRIDQVTPDSPNVKKAFELYDKGWKKKTIAEELGIDRTHLRKWFHKFRPEDIGDINIAKGGKYNYKAVRAQRIRELTSMLKKMPGGEKTLAQTIKVMDQIWDKNNEILKMTDNEIWNNKKFRDAMNLDVTGLKTGKGINFNRYKHLTKEEFVAKVKGMAKNKEFFQPEHIIPISSQRTASLFPKNIQVAIGKTGGQMEVLKNFALNNPDDVRIKDINSFLKNQNIQIGNIGFKKPIVVSSKTGKSNIVDAALKLTKPVVKQTAKRASAKLLYPAMIANELLFGRKFDEVYGFPLTVSRDVEQINELADMAKDKFSYFDGGIVSLKK